jgi:hypothetical protein
LSDNQKIKKEIDKVMSMLIDVTYVRSTEFYRETGAQFINGHGYIQHNIDDVIECSKQLMKLAHSNGYLGSEDKLETALKYADNEKFRQNSVVGRYLDGTIFYNAWHRLVCIDSKGREWCQPYYAINEDEGKDVKLNKFLRSETIDKLLKD